MKSTPLWAEERLDVLIERLEGIVRENQRPSNEVILNEDDVLSTLKICKRTLATLRADGLLKFSKVKGLIFYKLSDVLELIDSNRVNSLGSANRLLGQKKL